MFLEVAQASDEVWHEGLFHKIEKQREFRAL